MSPVALVQSVILTSPQRALLRLGFERQQQSSAHQTVKRIADKASLPKWLVGSACGVRGYGNPPLEMDLAQYFKLVEVLYADV